MTDEIEKGKSVRGGKLVPNTKYVMRAWGKPPTFSFVWFLGAGTSLATATAPEGQLKAQPVGTIFYFKIEDTVTEILPGSGWLGFPNDRGEPDPSKRVTFFLPLADAIEDSKQIMSDIAAEHGVTLPEEVISAAVEEIQATVEEEQAVAEEDQAAVLAEEAQYEEAQHEEVIEASDDQPDVPETVMPVEDEVEVITTDTVEQDPHLEGITNLDNASDEQPEVDTAAIAEHLEETYQKEVPVEDGESTAQRKARLKRERRAQARNKQNESVEG
jgi:hypothetical protein